MATEEVPATATLVPLRREAIVPSSDRGRLAAIVATCSLAGLAGGMALSMLAETQRAARERGGARYHVRVPEGPAPWVGLQVLDAKKGDCTGALVEEVTANGPADRVGFHAGDIVISYAGDRICGNDHLIEVIHASDIGATPEIEIVRGTRKMTLEPTLAEMPPRIRAALPPDQMR
jgi:predicted metalloprotease with PDZ domain